nr:MAG TPA: hypothetical protein [Caudoviricetes sp.]
MRSRPFLRLGGGVLGAILLIGLRVGLHPGSVWGATVITNKRGE